MLLEEKKKLIQYLSGFISERRKARFDEVIAHRTGHLRIVLEDLYQAHNASAVLRSCDCFGVQYVDFIENRNKFKISPDVAMGSSNWLSITRHNQQEQNTAAALQQLKKQGYRIVATTPHTNDVTLEKLPVDRKLALVFGTEIDGITDEVRQEADEFVRIPMYGFTESFNISVCAALCMYELTTRIRRDVPDYLLNEEEKTSIYLDWLKNSIEKSDAIVDLYYKEKGK
jgi:tRNA (guanosine-2'-O-)-methyltransferase